MRLRRTERAAGRMVVDEAALAAYDGPVPRHIAVIMDGNGRWAKGRGMPRIRGHHEGAQAVRRTVESCRYLGVEVLTLYAFSSQNWGRPEDEVSGLMALFDLYIQKERDRLIENQVALEVIGDRSRLSGRLRDSIVELERATAPGHEMVLQVAVSYGGREEIVRAARALAHRVARGEIEPEAIDEAALSAEMYTGRHPDPDLLVRTSGEMRLSNFLLWQIAYSELYVTEAYWPDFDEAHLLHALRTYAERERRYGKTSAQLESE